MSLQKEMDQIKVESYKDCVWYLENEDKCKLPGIGSVTSECYCKDKELEEICVWLTQFFKSTPDDACTESWNKVLGSLLREDTALDNEKKDGFISRFISDVKKKILK